MTVHCNPSCRKNDNTPESHVVQRHHDEFLSLWAMVDSIVAWLVHLRPYWYWHYPNCIPIQRAVPLANNRGRRTLDRNSKCVSLEMLPYGTMCF
jgi:hypothetical protein